MPAVFGDAAFKSTLAQMVRLGVPQQLETDADELRRAALLLAEFGGEVQPPHFLPRPLHTFPFLHPGPDPWLKVRVCSLFCQLARAELVGLRAEKKLTQRFRAPQTHGVLTAAHKLLVAVDALAQPAGRVDPEELSTLSEALEEVAPMLGSAKEDVDDELDDEI